MVTLFEKIVNREEKISVIGVDQEVEVKRLTIPDVYASVSYYLNLMENIIKFIFGILQAKIKIFIYQKYLVKMHMDV